MTGGLCTISTTNILHYAWNLVRNMVYTVKYVENLYESYVEETLFKKKMQGNQKVYICFALL